MPTFQPILQERNAPTYIKSGVANTAGAELIQNLGQMGVEAYVGYQEAQLEKGIESVVEDYFSQNLAYEEGQQAGEGANQLEKTYQAKLDQYKQAAEQGTMSVNELESRILATTREAINRNPGLMDVLLKRADRTLELSGVSSYIKAAKQGQMDQNAILQAAEKADYLEARGMGIRPWENPYWREELDLSRREQRISKQEEAVLKSNQRLSREQVGDWIARHQKETVPAIYTGISSRLTQLTTQVDKEGRPMPWAQVAVQMQREIGLMEEAIVSDVTNLRLADGTSAFAHQEVKDYVATKTKTLTELREVFEKVGSGELAKQEIENRLAVVRSSQELTTRGVINPSSVDVYNKLMSVSPVLARHIIQEKGVDGKSVLDKMLVSLETLSNQAFSPQLMLPGLDGKPVGINALDATLGAGSQGTDVSKELKDNLTTTYNGISDPKNRNRNTINYTAESIKSLADPKNFDAIKQLDPEGRKTATNLVDTYLEQVMVQSGVKMDELASKGVQVEWVVNPDGTFSLGYASGSVRNDPELAEINRIFSGHLNNAQKAFAHIWGEQDWRKMSREHFIPMYLDGVKSTKPTPITQKSGLSVTETGGTEPGTWKLESSAGTAKNWWED